MAGFSSNLAHQHKSLHTVSLHATTIPRKWRKSVSWLVFPNCDHSACVRVCAVAPPWQRQMDWEPQYLPEEAVYGSSSGESRRSLKFSFQVTAINLSRGVQIEPTLERVCQGRQASRRQSSCQRLRGTKVGKMMSSVSGHTVRKWKSHFWDFTFKKKQNSSLPYLQFSKIRVCFPINALQQCRKQDYCDPLLWQQRFVGH